MKNKPSYKFIIFCDFDGTITSEETFVSMLKLFAAESYSEVERRLVEKKISLAAAVRRLVESIPSSRFPQVLDFIRDKPLRPGFGELLDFLHFHGVPVVVVSGGLLPSVATRLAPFRHRILALHAAEVETGGLYLAVHSPYEDAVELVAKKKVMATYRSEQSIVIGDGITDLRAALNADVVFARDRLCDYLDAHRQPFIRWNDFFDICRILQKRWFGTKK